MFRPSSLQRLSARAVSSLSQRSSASGLAVKLRGGGQQICSSVCRNYNSTVPRCAETVSVTYVEADGSEKEVQAEVGKNLMEVAHDNDVELEGACGGELACSTCHLIFEEEVYDTLPEKDDEEDDMLDLAFEVTDTSRLGCQILVTKEMAGMKVKIPDDGF